MDFVRLNKVTVVERCMAVSGGSTVITGPCSDFNENLLVNDKTDQFRF